MSYLKSAAIAFLLLLTFPVQAQVPTFTYDDSGTYIQDWLLLGPIELNAQEPYPATTHLSRFKEDFLKPVGGETSPTLSTSESLEVDGKTLTWKVHHTESTSVNLDKAVSIDYPVMAYAYCEIESNETRGAVLALGSNDGGRAWLNGQPVWDRARAGALVPDEHLVPVALKKGKNTLLLKIEERGISWGFSARFLPLDNQDVLDRLQVFRIERSTDGSAMITINGTPSAAQHVLSQASFSLEERNDEEEIFWQHTWRGESKIPIEVDSGRYGEYTLRIKNTLSAGGVQYYTAPVALGQRRGYELFANGKSDYAIVLADDASDSEQWAAQELAKALKAISNIDFPIKRAGEHALEHSIIVGTIPEALQKLDTDIRGYNRYDEAFQYANFGSTIIIRGGSQRGTMYGVMDFLERELGCRWYTPSVTKFPTRNRYTFDYLYRQDSAGVQVRNDFYYEAFDPEWAAHNRVNGSMNHRKQPGGAEGYWRVHTFNLFVPPSQYFEDHPEYYSLIKGKRSVDRAQLCLTNPDVLRIVTERLREAMRAHPDNLIYSVSQNDWKGPCECNPCQAITKTEGSESGPMIHFVNAVADAVADEFPNKYVGTLAYQYTRKPPKHVKPRDNVVIRLCTIECCFAHPLDACSQNAAFMEDIQDWAKIAAHMYIWDYVVDFVHYLLPFPNFGALQRNIQIFEAHNAIGIMEQGAYQCPSEEFAELRAYVLSKLLWDPECNVDTVVDDFMYGYYGRSGQHIRAYFDLLQARVQPDTHLTISSGPLDKLFSDDFVRQADTLFDQAEAVAENEELLHRVETARLPLMYLKCLRMPHEAKRDGTYARFSEIVEREGVTYYSESGAPYRKEFHDMMDSLDQ